MIRPPTIAPGTDVNPPRISTGNAFSATKVSANCTPLRAPHNRPATSATKPATVHTIAQMCCSGMPDRQRRLVIVGDRAQRAPDLGFGKQHRQCGDQDRADRRRDQIELRNGDAGRVEHPLQRHVLDAEFERAPVEPQVSCASPSMKNDRPMVAMNSVISFWFTSGRSTMRSVASAKRHHHQHGQRRREPQAHAELGKPHAGERGEKHHRPCAKLNTPEAL